MVSASKAKSEPKVKKARINDPVTGVLKWVPEGSDEHRAYLADQRAKDQLAREEAQEAERAEARIEVAALKEQLMARVAKVATSVEDVYEQEFGDADPTPDDDEDGWDEPGHEVSPDLGPRPAPVKVEAEPQTVFECYYHAYLPHLTVKRGRKDAVRWHGGITCPTTALQEARVREALVKYVPGGNPDRWKGDTIDDDEEDLRCMECGYFTRNTRVWRDHMKHTGHDRR